MGAFVVLVSFAGSFAYAQAPQQLIAYVKPDPLLNNLRNLWLIRPDGTGDTFVNAGCIDPQRQCPLLSAEYPVWARDGRQLAFTGLLEGRRGGYVVVDWLMATNELKVLAALKTAGGGLPPAFSPDGAFLAFEDFDLFNSNRIKIVDIQRSLTIGHGPCSVDPRCTIDVTPGLGLVGQVQGLDWSPVENVLVVPGPAFSVSGNLQLLLVPPVFNGIAQARPLTHPPDALGFFIKDVFPVFSPNGAVVAYARHITNVVTSQNTSELRIVGRDGRGDRALLQPLANRIITGIGWSPDGSSLVFDLGQWPPGSLWDQGSFGLWTFNLTTGRISQIQPARSYAPSWGFRAQNGAGCARPPAAPSSVVGSVVAGVASARWSPVTGATSYVVKAGPSPGTASYFDGNVGNTLVVSAPVPPGFRAFVRVYAVNACGQSRPSTEILIQ